LLGVFDIGLDILRVKSSDRRRLIRGYARLSPLPDFLYEMDDAGELIVLGDPSAVSLTDLKGRLCDVVSADGQTTRQIRDALDEPRPSLEQVRRALTELAADRAIERDPPISEGSAQGRAVTWSTTSLPTDITKGGSEVVDHESGPPSHRQCPEGQEQDLADDEVF
jgi:hypothetical protein